MVFLKYFVITLINYLLQIHHSLGWFEPNLITTPGHVVYHRYHIWCIYMFPEIGMGTVGSHFACNDNACWCMHGHLRRHSAQYHMTNPPYSSVLRQCMGGLFQNYKLVFLRPSTSSGKKTYFLPLVMVFVMEHMTLNWFCDVMIFCAVIKHNFYITPCMLIMTCIQ